MRPIHQPESVPDAAQLLVVGEAALADGARELAYAVSGAGIGLGIAQARFLFLRARALPTWMDIRREGCLRAALELARRDRDTELAGKVLDHVGGRFGSGRQTDSLPTELQSEIIEEELKLKKFPAGPRDSQPRYAARLALQVVRIATAPSAGPDAGNRSTTGTTTKMTKISGTRTRMRGFREILCKGFRQRLPAFWICCHSGKAADLECDRTRRGPPRK